MEWKDVERLDDYRWRISKNRRSGMNVDGEVIATREILSAALADGSLEQVVHVASLPGIVNRSLAMPDIHYGYGFCIGGVAAFTAEEGIVLPGGVGYDINCGVRLIATDIPQEEALKIGESLGYAILKRIPTGLTDRSNYRLDKKEFFRVLERGAPEIVRNFSGKPEDLEFIESGGCLPCTPGNELSSKAVERGLSQVGTLGSGNHFIEVQSVEEIFDEAVAGRFGLQKGTIAWMIHTGSRGFGHQVATDYIEQFRRKNLSRLHLPDPQLVYAEVDSSEGKRYLHSLNAAANFAWANRHLIMEDMISLFEQFFHSTREKLGIRLVYDQAHNIAKMETHRLKGKELRLLVHRKGATRAFPPGHPDIPQLFRDVGQPVLIPGSMGTRSYILKGTEKAMELTFGSSAHGAGRKMSRHQAIKFSSAYNVRERMKEKNVLVFSLSNKGLREEIPEAYKEIDEVVETTVKSGISQKVARLKPLLVIKG